jgi:cytochrome c oxidase subunit 2
MSVDDFDEEVHEDLQRSVLSGEPFFSRPAGKIFGIWVVLTAVGVFLGLYAPSHLLPRMLSVEGHDATITIVLFTVLAAPVAAFVYAVGAYSLLAWRHRSEDPDEVPPDGPPMRGNGPMTVLWLVVSTLLVVVLLVWGLGELASEQAPQADPLQVNVTGQQWLWSFSYPGTGVETRSLVLPVGRAVQFNVTSVDVTHGFWAASLGVQVDANPSVVTVIEATPNRTGTFVVRCSQLCGLYHAFMYAQGSVVTPSQFSAWLQAQGASSSSAAQTSGVSS